jgi:hypothetical protein
VCIAFNHPERGWFTICWIILSGCPESRSFSRNIPVARTSEGPVLYLIQCDPDSLVISLRVLIWVEVITGLPIILPPYLLRSQPHAVLICLFPSWTATLHKPMKIAHCADQGRGRTVGTYVTPIHQLMVVSSLAPPTESCYRFQIAVIFYYSEL